MNWGIIVAALASFFFGWLFYSPLLFGNYWMRLSGIKMTKKPKTSDMVSRMFVALIAAGVTSWVLWMFMNAFAASSIQTAFAIVWRLWLGFLVSTTLIGTVLWEGKRIELFILGAVYWFLNLMIMAWVLLAF